MELAPPNVYDAKYVKWSIADLPILPQKWQYLVSAGTKKQFGILQKLMHRPDVDSIVNSCDAGREGELIFRLVYQQAGCKKALFPGYGCLAWKKTLSGKGFAHLKPSTEYDALYNAALCRERADWMVGIKCVPAFFFVPVRSTAGGGACYDPGACHDGGAGSRHCRLCAGEILHGCPEPLQTAALHPANDLHRKRMLNCCFPNAERRDVSQCRRWNARKSPKAPPQLYDLTALQRDANRLLGFTAQQTLDYAQSLYEKRLITPRTDSRFLTDDMAASLPGLVTDTGKGVCRGGAEFQSMCSKSSTAIRSQTTTRCCPRKVWQTQTLPPSPAGGSGMSCG